MNRSRTIVTSIALSLALGSIVCVRALADEDASAELAKAPPAVQATAKKALGDKKLEEFDKEEVGGGKVMYEAGWKENDVDHDVLISESGQIIQTEVDVEQEKLPAAVTDAVKKAHADGKLGEAAQATTPDGKQYFSLDVKVGDDTHVMNIAADGKVLSDEVEKASAEEKDKDPKDEDKDKGGKKDEKKD
jgi:hypothetical protein